MSDPTDGLCEASIDVPRSAGGSLILNCNRSRGHRGDHEYAFIGGAVKWGSPADACGEVGRHGPCDRPANHEGPHRCNMRLGGLFHWDDPPSPWLVEAKKRSAEAARFVVRVVVERE